MLCARGASKPEWPFGTPSQRSRENSAQRFNRGFDGEPLLNADEKPPGGLAFGSFGSSRGSVLYHLNRKQPTLEVLSTGPGSWSIGVCHILCQATDKSAAATVSETMELKKRCEVKRQSFTSVLEAVFRASGSAFSAM